MSVAQKNGKLRTTYRLMSSHARVGLGWIVAVLAILVAWGMSWITTTSAIEAGLPITAACFTVLLVRFGLRRRNEHKLRELVSHQIDQTIAARHSFQDQQLLKAHLRHIIKLLQASRATGGQGAHALSELPWYLVLGPKGAGKTSLLTHSGLSINNAGNDSTAEHGGQEQCDWYFCSQAVFIETASRYLDDARSAEVFVNFLKLLKKQRKPIAINGIVLTVSLEQLVSATPAERLQLAERLSARVSDYAQSLGAIPPIHLVLTKVDQLPGFVDVFASMSAETRRQPWGIVLGDHPSSGGEEYDLQFEALLNQLHAYVHQLSLCGSAPATADTLQFANYLLGLSESLKAFLLQLEGSGPFVRVRSVHFTSAHQGGESLPAVFKERVVEAYGLKALEATAQVEATRGWDHDGFFITDLFRQIIFPGRYALLHQPSLGHSRRLGKTFKFAILALGIGALMLKGFYFLSDQKTMKALSLAMAEPGAVPQSPDPLQAWQSLGELRAYLSALETPAEGQAHVRNYRDRHALQAVHQSLHNAFAHQMQAALITPLEKHLQGQLTLMSSFPQRFGEAADLPPSNAPGERVEHPMKGIVPSDLEEQRVASVADTYEALKLYLVITDPDAHPEADFVAATLGRVWERVLSDEGVEVDPHGVTANSAAYLKDLTAGRAPKLRRNDELVSALQTTLKSFMVQSSWADHEYVRLQLEFNHRFAPLTLDDMTPEAGRKSLYSTESVPVLYTLQGWKLLQVELVKWLASDVKRESDWVLEGGNADSAAVQKAQFLRELLARYKDDYAQSWYRFLRGTGVRHAEGLHAALQELSGLSDLQDSPLKAFLHTVDLNTRWDLPASVSVGPSGAETDLVPLLSAHLREIQDGSLAKRFEPVSQLFAIDGPEGNSRTIMDRYLASLRMLKARASDILRSQNVGKSGKRLISETLDGQPTEIAAVRQQVERYVDTSNRGVAVELRRMFSAPVENTWSALTQLVGGHVSDEWARRIVQPWQKRVAHRYPMTASASNEVSVKDVTRFVRPDSGLVAAFRREQIGNLVEGEGLGERPADQPQAFVTPRVLASIGKASAIGELLDSLADPENGFELMISPSSAYTDIIFTLDGQQVHYRNGKVRWYRFVWPALSDAPGARMDVVTLEGKRVSVFDFPGRWGLLKMSDSARVAHLDEVRQQFSWSSDAGPVSLIVRNHGGMKLTGLAAIKSLNFVSDNRRPD